MTDSMARFGKIPQSKKIALLESAYYDLYKELSSRMLSLEPGSYTEAEGMSLLRKSKDMIADLNRFVVTWSRSVIPAAYDEAQGIALKRLKALGAEKNPRFKDKTHTKAKTAETDTMIDDMLKANTSIEKNVGMYVYIVRKASKELARLEAFIGDLRDEEVVAGLIDDAVKAGKSRGKLEQLIREHFKRQLYERKWININGREYDLIKYARLVARTRMRIVQTEAVKNECKEYDNDLIEISNHGTVCEECKEFEGNVYSISGKTPGYDQIPEWPPYHPNCEHHAMPTSAEAIEWRRSA